MVLGLAQAMLLAAAMGGSDKKTPAAKKRSRAKASDADEEEAPSAPKPKRPRK